MENIREFYDPESMTFKEQEEKLTNLYQRLYPWHGTEEARHYDYPKFSEAVRSWASDEFYIQHLTAKLYCKAIDEIFEEPINAWQFD